MKKLGFLFIIFIVFLTNTYANSESLEILKLHSSNLEHNKELNTYNFEKNSEVYVGLLATEEISGAPAGGLKPIVEISPSNSITASTVVDCELAEGVIDRSICGKLSPNGDGTPGMYAVKLKTNAIPAKVNLYIPGNKETITYDLAPQDYIEETIIEEVNESTIETGGNNKGIYFILSLMLIFLFVGIKFLPKFKNT